MDTLSAFGVLGFSEKQARVYEALLSIGKATAYAIAKKSGLKRPTVYVVLEELREREVVLKIPYAKKQVYIAKSPELLVARASADILALKNFLPTLLGLMPKDHSPRVLFFEGQKEMRELLWHPHHSDMKEIVGFYAFNKQLPTTTIQLIDTYNDFLRTQHIRVRGIVPDHPSLRRYRRQDADFQRHMKIIPSTSYESTISLDIGPDFIRIISYTDHMGVIIEHPQIAQALRQIFGLVWSATTTTPKTR